LVPGRTAARHPDRAAQLQPQLRSLHYCCPSAQDHLHGTRKTCASLLAALDVHPRVAMRILRRSKIAVTMEIYTEAPSEATRDALRKLSAWLA
jgi:hypothetical protein